MSDDRPALELAKVIEKRASDILRYVMQAVDLSCGSDEEFRSIMLLAVEEKVVAHRRESERRSKGKMQ